MTIYLKHGGTSNKRLFCAIRRRKKDVNLVLEWWTRYNVGGYQAATKPLIFIQISVPFKGNAYTTLSKLFGHPSEKGSALKGKNLFPMGANSFL